LLHAQAQPCSGWIGLKSGDLDLEREGLRGIRANRP
jgi:hypothetical protein